MNDFLLHAFSLSAGKSKPLSLDAREPFDREAVVWLHFDGTDANTATWLRQNASSIHPHIIDELVAEETRPRTQQVGNGLLIVLRGVNLNKNADPEDMVSIRLWVEENKIYSVRCRRLKAVSEIVKELKSGNGPSSASEFICLLIEKLSLRMEVIFSSLDELTDDVEESILTDPIIELRQTITQIRKQAIIFRRYMSPQRDAITQLIHTHLSWLDDSSKIKLQESHNKITRFIEDLDAIRERAQIVKDELMSHLSDRMNKNMYILSVIAALFLPLGFLTGLLGINLGGIPGANSNEAFYIFCSVLIVIVAFQIILFKKMKWF